MAYMKKGFIEFLNEMKRTVKNKCNCKLSVVPSIKELKRLNKIIKVVRNDPSYFIYITQAGQRVLVMNTSKEINLFCFSYLVAYDTLDDNRCSFSSDYKLDYATKLNLYDDYVNYKEER